MSAHGVSDRLDRFPRIQRFGPIDVAAVEVLLCDADGNLFGSEEPAFAASAVVTNELLSTLGLDSRFTPDALRRRAMGKNFRLTALELAGGAGVAISADELERWVEAEQREVVGHLSNVLRPDDAVRGPLAALATRFRLAVVSSSSTARLDACLAATALGDLFPRELRFSAEDSLPTPTSKPDPAIYLWAGRCLEVEGAAALAVEDAVPGVRSAVGAGFPTVGNLQFVPGDERSERVAALRGAGAVAIVRCWSDLAALLVGD